MANAADALKAVPFFSALNARQAKRLGSKFKERRFDSGTAVVQEGTMSGIGFFIVAEGEATVSVAGTEVAKLGPGDHFGELGLIAERERTATVTARTQLDCLELPVWDFREFVQSDSDVSWKLLQYVVNVLLDERSSAGPKA
jgi:CRP-like cAMP-binding protein